MHRRALLLLIVIFEIRLYFFPKNPGKRADYKCSHSRHRRFEPDHVGNACNEIFSRLCVQLKSHSGDQKTNDQICTNKHN